MQFSPLISQFSYSSKQAGCVQSHFQSQMEMGSAPQLQFKAISDISLGLEEVYRSAEELLECVVLSQTLAKTECARALGACVCVNIASPSSCITRGSLLVSPGDSQSVLALQYKEIIVIFKKLPLQLGSDFCKPMCGTAQLEYMFVCERQSLYAC